MSFRNRIGYEWYACHALIFLEKEDSFNKSTVPRGFRTSHEVEAKVRSRVNVRL